MLRKEEKMKRGVLYGICALALLFAGCGGGSSTSPAQSFTLTSTAFSEGGTIPQKYTCDGQDISPPLKWSGAPKEAKSFVLIVTDPDAPGGTFTHWVVYDIPADQTELQENVQKQAQVGSIKQGSNDFGSVGYGGPCPPQGDKPHRYVFTLHALSVNSLNLQGGATKGEVENAMNGKVIDRATLTGKYGR